MTAELSPILLDISRTISRAAFPIPTGIDRVERAYIDHYLNSDHPIWFLSRIAGGFALLDRTSMQKIMPMITGMQPWQKPDLIARLFGRKKPKPMQRAESTLRRVANTWSGKKQLVQLLKNVPHGFTYINVGHSNRHADLWDGINKSHAHRAIAMIHDVIPLDFPEFTRPDTQQKFENELKMTARNCDYLIYNSSDTAKRTEHWLKIWGIETPGVTALLGIKPPDRVITPKSSEKPYFVCLGTIEPRKNHRLLLDIWQRLSAELTAENLPHLHIVGRRGWLNKDVFDILDTSPMMGNSVFEHNNMDDNGVAELLAGARALLFPSFAEGFGYPLVEALQNKIPAICSNLPCFQELSANGAVYLDPTENQAWKIAILENSCQVADKKPQKIVDFPSWPQHFLKIDTIV